MKRWGLALALITLLAGGWGALAWVSIELPAPLAELIHLPERLLTRWIPPRGGRLKDLTPEEREAARTLARRLDARIVWSSNRGGNHDLYLLNLKSLTLRRLTTDPHVDFFSRFSPDGTKIVFLRSQRPWVSFREETAWDVYLINADGSGERLLARGGYHPTWTADGRGIIFHRQTRVFRYDLASGQESLVLDVAKEFPGVTEFGDVELSPDGRRWAFPLRGNFRGAFGLSGSFSGAAVFDAGARTLAFLTREQACQTTWAPHDGAVLWMAASGHGGTQVMRAPAPGAPGEVFMDLPGRYSHEYFPKLSNDGRWLVWGAAAEGHEHDRADYEIFLWEVGTPWEQAVRLTHHPGNDQWPDLFVGR